MRSLLRHLTAGLLLAGAVANALDAIDLLRPKPAGPCGCPDPDDDLVVETVVVERPDAAIDAAGVMERTSAADHPAVRGYLAALHVEQLHEVRRALIPGAAKDAVLAELLRRGFS